MPLDRDLSRRVGTAACAGWAVTLTALAALVGNMALRLAGGPASDLLSGDWLYLSVLLAASGATALRAATLERERLVWALMGVAGLLWSLGELYWRANLAHMDEPPFPSPADALYLGFYPPAYVALVLLIRARVRHFHASLWLDGLASALGLGAFAATFVLPAVLESSTGGVAAVVTNVAYPLGDLIVLGMVGALAALTAWRAGRALGLLAAGCVLFALADVLFFLRAADGTVAGAGLSEMLWPAAIVLIGLAAWQPQREPHPGRLEGWSLMIIPTAVSLASLVVIVHGLYAQDGVLAAWLAIAALLVCMARAAITFRENIALADSHRQAVTDALTGLPNRRLFLDRAERALAGATRTGEQVAVMIIDLDRFKEVNDTLGHQSGDVLLQEIGRRLAAVVRESDTVARLGGDEFAVLLPGVADAAAVEAVAEALGQAIAEPIVLGKLSLDIEASIGVACFPGDGQDVGAAPAARRRRDVHGQGEPPRPRALRPRARRLQPRAARAGRRAAPGARRERAGAALPAEGRSCVRAHLVGRGAGPLAAPHARPAAARRVRAARRADRPDQAPDAARAEPRADAGARLAP